MLNVAELSNVISENIEVDPYIPLKIRWDTWNLIDEQTTYWRTGDLKKSLLEIGIASKTGLIRSLTVVHTDRILLNGTKLNWQAPVENGTPIFVVVALWLNNDKVDDSGLFEIHFCDSEVNLILSRNEIKRKVLSERVCFGLDSGSNVSLVNINGLTKDESMQIKDTLMFMRNQN